MTTECPLYLHILKTGEIPEWGWSKCCVCWEPNQCEACTNVNSNEHYIAGQSDTFVSCSQCEISHGFVEKNDGKWVYVEQPLEGLLD